MIPRLVSQPLLSGVGLMANPVFISFKAEDKSQEPLKVPHKLAFYE